MGCSQTKSSNPIIGKHVYRCNSFYRTVEDIPPIAFKEHRIIPCQVVRVIDGDTIRCRHVPSGHLYEDAFASSPKKEQLWRKRLRFETLLLRIIGVDCPEMGKDNEPDQPFAGEATDFVTSCCLDRVVYIKLFSKDQYGRALALVVYGQELNRLCYLKWCCLMNEKLEQKDISEELLKKGLATIYYGKGAEYDNRKALYEKLQLKAKKEQRGLWQKESMELPQDYKRRLKKDQNQTVISNESENKNNNEIVCDDDVINVSLGCDENVTDQIQEYYYDEQQEQEQQQQQQQYNYDDKYNFNEEEDEGIIESSFVLMDTDDVTVDKNIPITTTRIYTKKRRKRRRKKKKGLS